MRIDRNANESLSPFEIAAFLRDNKEYTITESDCSLFVNYYDQDKDNKLNYYE